MRLRPAVGHRDRAPGKAAAQRRALRKDTEFGFRAAILLTRYLVVVEIPR
jgi:hypothetical protein